MRYEIRVKKNNSIGYEVLFSSSNLDLLLTRYRFFLHRYNYGLDLYCFDKSKNEDLRKWY